MRLWSRVENDYREALSAERYAEGFFFFFLNKSATFCSWEIGNWMKRQMFSSGEIGLT